MQLKCFLILWYCLHEYLQIPCLCGSGGALLTCTFAKNMTRGKSQCGHLLPIVFCCISSLFSAFYCFFFWQHNQATCSPVKLLCIYRSINQSWPSPAKGQPAERDAGNQCKYICVCHVESEVLDPHVPVTEDCAESYPGSWCVERFFCRLLVRGHFLCSALLLIERSSHPASLV